MHSKSLKLQPSSSSSAKGHVGKHEERARNHDGLLVLWVAFHTEALQQTHVLCPCSNLSACCDPFSSKTFSEKYQATNGKKSPLLHYFIFCRLSTWIVKMSRWPQHYENDSTSWSFQTLAFAMIWNCWKRAPLLKCSDIVCVCVCVPLKHQNIKKPWNFWNMHNVQVTTPANIPRLWS